MKRIMLHILLIASMSLCFSCGPASNDEIDEEIKDEEIKDEEIKDEVDESLKPFIGYWDHAKNSYHYYEWLFAPDKTCKFYIDGQLEAEGDWTYNPTTSILATTIESYSWQVIISTENSWAGICLDKDKDSQSFTRLPDHEIAKYEIVGSWDRVGYGEGSRLTFEPYQYNTISDVPQSGNVYKTYDGWKFCYYYWKFVEEGDDYDGVCRALDNHIYVDGSNHKTDRQLTMTMTIDDNYRMTQFVTEDEQGNVATYVRMETEE